MLWHFNILSANDIVKHHYPTTGVDYYHYLLAFALA